MVDDETTESKAAAAAAAATATTSNKENDDDDDEEEEQPSWKTWYFPPRIRYLQANSRRVRKVRLRKFRESCD